MSLLKAFRPAFQPKRSRGSESMSAPHDIEKGPPPTTTTERNASESSHSQEGEGDRNPHPAPTEGLVPVSDKLATFRTLVGIKSADPLTVTSILKRPAPNLGIYGRTVHAERHAKQDYKIWSTLINGCLGLQIIVAAALTALGAAGAGHGAAVTTFGAVNTVIAGFLTYLKGSGLPNRLKYYENEWMKVREYIEQRERDFGSEGCQLVLEVEVAEIERMFEEVRADIQANTPDSYVSMGQSRGRGVAPLPAIAKPPGEKTKEG